MRPSPLIVLGAVALAAAALWHAGSSSDGGRVQLAAPATAASATGSPRPSPPRTLALGPVALASSARPVAAPPEPPIGSGETPDLRADANGRLVTDAHTRDELERLIALNDRADALTLLQRLEAVLPPAAYRQAVDAFYAYQNYAIAASQLVSPAQPVQDEVAASRQLAALHALRVEHFGPDVAAAYFGDEEATAEHMLAEMRSHPETGGTLAERAAKAEADALAPR